MASSRDGCFDGCRRCHRQHQAIKFTAALAASSLLLALPRLTVAAEYQRAEQTAPTSAAEIDNTLGQIAVDFVRDPRVVFQPLDEWRQTT